MDTDDLQPRFQAMVIDYQRIYVNYHSNPSIQTNYDQFQEISGQVEQVFREVADRAKELHKTITHIQTEVALAEQKKEQVSRRLAALETQTKEANGETTLLKSDAEAQYWALYRQNAVFAVGVMGIVKLFYM